LGLERTFGEENQPKSEQKPETALDYTRKFAVTAPCSKYFPDFLNHGLVISDLHQILRDSFGNDSFGFEEVLGILHNCSL
jgi:hypothetical protein